MMIRGIKDMSSWFKHWAPKDHGNETDEDHMRKMYSVGKLGSKLVYFNPVTTALAAGGIWGFAIWAMVAQQDAAEDAEEAQQWVTDVWNWLYMISQNVWIVVLLYLLFKYYNLKLGKDTVFRHALLLRRGHGALVLHRGSHVALHGRRAVDGHSDVQR
jgi:hypothetical protein